MAKNKTHKGAKKRFKVTTSGKVTKRKAFASHLLTKKSAGRKRKLRKPLVVKASDSGKIRGLLGL